MNRTVSLYFLFIVTAMVYVAQPPILALEGWYELKGTHFIIFYPRGGQYFAREVLRKAEANYNEIADFLRYARRSGFWTWDNRVNIYIYPDKASYVKGTSAPDWSNGVADYMQKTISSYADNQDFLESVLAYEMAHFVFRDFVGFREEIPMWLDAGIAQWAQVSQRDKRHRTVKAYADAGLLMPLNSLMEMHVQKLGHSSRAYVQPAIGREEETVMVVPGDRLVELYYLESFSVVGFLVERFGPDSFAVFCRGLRDLKTLDEALAAAYPEVVEDMETLERVWLEHIKAE